MTKKKEKLDPFVANLISLLKSLDNRIAREMQRTPEQREKQGVQKWKPKLPRTT